MKKLAVFSFLFSLIMSACNSSADVNSGSQTKDSLTTASQANNNKSPKSDRIKGVWRLVDDKMVRFEITNDSIYYPDQEKKYLYKTNEDSIFIYYDDWTYRGKYKLEADGLTISDSSNASSYTKGN